MSDWKYFTRKELQCKCGCGKCEMDEGFMEPTYLSAKGEDPEAYYKGQSHAWGVYQVREWKRVLIISGGAGRERRMQITETP